MSSLDINVEMNYCRRCGSKVYLKEKGHVYDCEQGHRLFVNASPAMGVWLLNDKNEVLVLERACDPGKGMYDAPGGFCDGAETLKAAAIRELQEEIGLSPEDYSEPQYISEGSEAYEFGDERLPVLTVMFAAYVITSKQPVAGDDAATASWIPLKDVDLTKVYFPVVREALAQLQKHA